MNTPEHSYWSASKFESIMLCPGKIVLEDGAPENTSSYAAEGTAAHQVLTWALQEDRPAAAYIGRLIHLDARGKVCEPADAAYTYEVDAEMAEHVQVCIDYVNDLRGDDGVVFADIRVNYSSYLDTPVESAWGTADVVVARGSELIVVDFKYGRGVEVSAERNPQMSLYALGALQAYQGLVADFERVRMAIVQPRVKRAPSEWDCSVEELEAWGRSTARSAVASCKLAAEFKNDTPVEPELWEQTFLRPGEKQCKFCKAKATCPALRAEVASAVSSSVGAPASPDEFADLDVVAAEELQYADDAWLSAALGRLDLIEDWCKAVRAEAERRLLAGQPVPGWKLVQGKKGARQWQDAKAAEELLKSMRLKQEDMYEMKLISPTTAEKLHKAGVIGPRQWPRLQELITQSEGKPHVAPESDSRPALVVTPVVEEFADLTAEDLA
jgi:hypothetical protein